MTDDPRLRRPIATLRLTERARALLDHQGIRTVGEVVALGHRGCLRIRGFGKTSLRSVREALGNIGLRLADDE